MRMLQVGESRIGSKIMEILGIEHKFLHTTPLFSSGTKNGDDFGSDGGTKLPMRFSNVTSWKKGCDFDVSCIRYINFELVFLISDTVDQTGVCLHD